MSGEARHVATWCGARAGMPTRCSAAVGSEGAHAMQCRAAARGGGGHAILVCYTVNLYIIVET